jgi:hypothetical protein
MLAELFAMVRYQSAAIAYGSRPDPFQVFALAMLGGMMKRVMHLETVAERESGTFRTVAGAKMFCQIRGYNSTARKNGQRAIVAPQAALAGRPFIPPARSTQCAAAG